jgi:hypothetical protein
LELSTQCNANPVIHVRWTSTGKARTLLPRRYTQISDCQEGELASEEVFGALATFFGQVLQGYEDVLRRKIVNFVGTLMIIVLTVP